MTGPDQIQMTGPDTSDQMTGTGPEPGTRTGPDSQTIRPDNRIQTRPYTDTAGAYSNMYSKS